MLTNGMTESITSKVHLREVSPEAFKTILDYMYSGEFSTEDLKENQSLLLHVLFLADQFDITLLQQECCKILLECLSEVVSCTFTLNLPYYFIIIELLLFFLLIVRGDNRDGSGSYRVVTTFGLG